MIFVVDASVAVKWFVQEALSEQALDLITPGLSRVAPDLVFSEVGNALWAKMRKGEITSDQAKLAFKGLGGFFDRIVSSRDIAVRALEIAEALDHPIYDCFYLGCVEEVDDAHLVTDDKRLIDKSQESGEYPVIALAQFSSNVKPELRISEEKLNEALRLSEFYQTLSRDLRETLKQENGLVLLSHDDQVMMIQTPAFRNLISYIQELDNTEKADLLALCWFAYPISGQQWLGFQGRADQWVAANTDESAIRYIASKLLFLERGLELYRDL